jgi:hypothetical protein
VWPKENDAQIAAAPLPQRKAKKAPEPKKVVKHKKRKAAPKPVTCAHGFHVEGRNCVKDIVVGPIAKKHKVKKHKRAAEQPAAAQASMFASPAVWIGSAVVLGSLAWFMMRKKPGTALAKAA